jgi:hypothetical protein
MSLPPFRNTNRDTVSLIHHWHAQRQAQNAVHQIVQQQASPARRVAVFKTIHRVDRSSVDGELLLQAQIILFGDKTKEGHLVESVAIPWKAIIKEWERDPDFIFRLKPRQLEELVAGAYEQAGCHAMMEPS